MQCITTCYSFRWGPLQQFTCKVLYILHTWISNYIHINGYNVVRSLCRSGLLHWHRGEDSPQCPNTNEALWWIWVNKSHNSTSPWRHNERDGVSNSPASRLFTQPFIQAHIKEKKNQSSALLAFVRGIHRWPLNSLHIGPVTRKMFLFDDVIMARTDGETTGKQSKVNSIMYME